MPVLSANETRSRPTNPSGPACSISYSTASKEMSHDPVARAGQHTEAIIEDALESLTNLRSLPCPDDPGVRLHTLASLALQIHTTLAAAVLEAR